MYPDWFPLSVDPGQMEEMDRLSIGVPEFFDLKQPWLYSPR